MDKGGYIVHDVPGPSFINKDNIIKQNLPGSRVNLERFARGKPMSPLWRHKGISILPNPPTRAGITMKKIIVMACTVSTLEYCKGVISLEPGNHKWSRSNHLSDAPDSPDMKEKVK